MIEKLPASMVKSLRVCSVFWMYVCFWDSSFNMSTCSQQKNNNGATCAAADVSAPPARLVTVGIVKVGKPLMVDSEKDGSTAKLTPSVTKEVVGVSVSMITGVVVLCKPDLVVRLRGKPEEVEPVLVMEAKGEVTAVVVLCKPDLVVRLRGKPEEVEPVLVMEAKGEVTGVVVLCKPDLVVRLRGKPEEVEPVLVMEAKGEVTDVVVLCKPDLVVRLRGKPEEVEPVLVMEAKGEVTGVVVLRKPRGVPDVVLRLEGKPEEVEPVLVMEGKVEMEVDLDLGVADKIVGVDPGGFDELVDNPPEADPDGDLEVEPGGLKSDGETTVGLRTDVG